MGDATLNMAVGTENNTVVRFTHLAMNSKHVPPEFVHGVFAAVVETSAETIDQAIRDAGDVTSILLDSLTLLSGAATSEPYWMFALRIDPDATPREVLIWDMWNRAPEFHRYVDKTLADGFSLWQEALQKLPQKQFRHLAHTLHWFRIGLGHTRGADRFSAFWSALESINADLILTAPTWAGTTSMPPEKNELGNVVSNRGIMLLGRHLTGSDEVFRNLLRFRNDLLHGNIYPPAAQNPIEGRDAITLLWIMEALPRVLALNPQDTHVEQWRENIQDFRVLGNIRIAARGQFWDLPSHYWNNPEQKPPLTFSMKKHGKVLLIQLDSRVSGPFDLIDAGLWGPRQYTSLRERLSIQIEDRAQGGRFHDNPYTHPTHPHKKKPKKKKRRR